MSVDISGLDKVELLQNLWQNSPPAAFFRMNGIPPPPFDSVKAESAVTQYIDYFEGRIIKADLSGDSADSALYNRDQTKKTFEQVVQDMRQ